jgi:hypothetical protein
MYQFFAKNEELKSKKESKKYSQQCQLGPQQHLLGPHLHILIHVINFVQITNLCPCHHPFKE